MTDSGIHLDHAGPRNLHRLVEAVLAVAADLEPDAVLGRFVETAADLVGARYGALGVVDDDRRFAELVTVGIDEETRAAIGPLPSGSGVLGSVADGPRSRRIAQLDEEPDHAGFPPHHPPMRSFLGVPVRVRGELFGSLYLTDKTTAEVFSDVDEELTSALAAAAGIAIENAGLYEGARRRERLLASLNSIATAVLEGTGLDRGLGVAASAARELLGAVRASVSLLDGADHLRVAVADGDHAEELVGHRWAFADTPCGDVLSGAPPIAVDDATEIARIGQTPLRDGRVGPALFVALAAGPTSFGVLTVARARGAAPFSAAEIELGQAFASQASVVLDHERGRLRRDELVKLEDQERIGRLLQDVVVQRLYAVGLTLHGTSRLTDDDALRERLQHAIADLDETIASIRAGVFES